MNDKTKSKVDTKIEAEELTDEELENVAGGAVFMKYGPVKGGATPQADPTKTPEIKTGYKR